MFSRFQFAIEYAVNAKMAPYDLFLTRTILSMVIISSERLRQTMQLLLAVLSYLFD
jgi:hypothetical protein